MNGTDTTESERQRQILERLNRLHADTLARLSELKGQQVNLYRRVSERLNRLVIERTRTDLDSSN
ncbi:hypothetical protein JW899_02160 [Candidatus Uhrbacteria bacterium]|nr:hypothetical protein [Candidatus Uhrbacteria bacterium]